ncbi:MAG: cytochrome B, partial [Proteobacteria bacterium]|nr:cytochrome B [Pseudomonadota bacterium]
GSKGVGPTFKGLYGREVTVTTDGKERRLRVDKDYLRRAILEPGADIAKGFPAVMPGNFREQLSQPELEAIVSFIQTLGQPGAGDAREAED